MVTRLRAFYRLHISFSLSLNCSTKASLSSCDGAFAQSCLLKALLENTYHFMSWHLKTLQNRHFWWSWSVQATMRIEGRMGSMWSSLAAWKTEISKEEWISVKTTMVFLYLAIRGKMSYHNTVQLGPAVILCLKKWALFDSRLDGYEEKVFK